MKLAWRTRIKFKLSCVVGLYCCDDVVNLFDRLLLDEGRASDAEMTNSEEGRNHCIDLMSGMLNI